MLQVEKATDENMVPAHCMLVT